MDLTASAVASALDQFKERYGKYGDYMHLVVCIEDILPVMQFMDKILWDYPKLYYTCDRGLKKYAWYIYGVVDSVRCEIYSEGA